MEGLTPRTAKASGTGGCSDLSLKIDPFAEREVLGRRIVRAVVGPLKEMGRASAFLLDPTFPAY
jgi:hypothetical protein